MVDRLFGLRLFAGVVLACFIALPLTACGGGNSGPAPDDEADPAEITLGERLFLETRFAQFFFANFGGNMNAALAAGDPSLDTSETTGAPLTGPFRGKSMNCRACHLVDEHFQMPGGGMRTYNDFARRSPVPDRGDGQSLTARNSPPLVNSTLARVSPFFLHFDAEFVSTPELVIATLTGRNYGWLPGEFDDAVAHIAAVIRGDNGQGGLAGQFGNLSYRRVFESKSGTPTDFRLPPEFRVPDVDLATDEELLNAVANLISAYVEDLFFAINEHGNFEGSPFDRFLAANFLPSSPAAFETDLDYSRRLRQDLLDLNNTLFITPNEENQFATHSSQSFRFGPDELAGLMIFLTEPDELPLNGGEVAAGGIGNCVACHAAPAFTDFMFHNIGAAQSEYDAIHGNGSFEMLAVPDLATRDADPDLFLPPTPANPGYSGRFRAVPMLADPDLTDLGLWNIFANDDHPLPQFDLTQLIAEEQGIGSGAATEDVILPLTLGRFKTPGLRDLSHSGPYFHTGQKTTLQDVLQHYRDFSDLARAGDVRNAAPQLAGIALTEADVALLIKFLRALNEDYE